MTTISFLIEWAIRSSILIVSGAILLKVFRVKDPSIKLASLIAILCGSLAIPALNPVLPRIPLPSLRSAAPQPIRTEVFVTGHAQSIAHISAPLPALSESKFSWPRFAAVTYLAGVFALLLRLCIGIEMSRRMLRKSRDTCQTTNEIAIRESEAVSAPITIGLFRSVIVLPNDWREWDAAKLAAVLAHETSHIQRKDPVTQLLSAIHRALIWHSPLSWFLHQRIVRTAEEASDDAALAVTQDRESYAEMLLQFMQRGVRGAHLQAVAMARYGQPAQRITRILDSTSLSRGITRWSMLAILALGSPLVYVVTAAQAPMPAPIPPMPPAPPRAAITSIAALPQTPEAPPPPPQSPQPPAPPAPAQRSTHFIRRYMIVSGNNISGSWDSSDRADEQELRAKFGDHFAWFWQGHADYVVTDAGVLKEIDEALAPQMAVNRMQDDVNKQQDVVNQHQSEVNRAQDHVNLLQDGVNRRQHIIDELQSAKGDGELIRRLEAALAELKANKGETNDQDSVNQEQSKVNAMQSRINEEQSKVNAAQSKVNEQQTRVSAQFEGRIETILDSAVSRHLAQQLK